MTIVLSAAFMGGVCGFRASSARLATRCLKLLATPSDSSSGEESSAYLLSFFLLDAHKMTKILFFHQSVFLIVLLKLSKAKQKYKSDGTNVRCYRNIILNIIKFINKLNNLKNKNFKKNLKFKISRKIGWGEGNRSNGKD